MNMLKAQQITVKIAGKTICQHINLSMAAGEVWGILGANGSGKTTLLQTLAGLHCVDAGEIFLDEKPIRTLSIKTKARKLGFLFQDFNAAFPQTVWEYCLSGRFPHLAYFKLLDQRDKDIVAYALKAMELIAFKNKSIQQLSGGEKRRLAIAALLVQTPCFYLLDEPTNHLDIRHQQNVLHIMQTLAREKKAAIVMTLHDIHLAQQFCDHILMLMPNGGIYQGKTQEILTEENVTALYQCPVKKVCTEAGVFWQNEKLTPLGPSITL